MVNDRIYKPSLFCKSLQGPLLLGLPVVLDSFHHNRLVGLLIPVKSATLGPHGQSDAGRPFNEFFGWDIMDADSFQSILDLRGQMLNMWNKPEQDYPLPGEIEGVGIVVLHPHLASRQLRPRFPLRLTDPLTSTVGGGHPAQMAAALQ